METSISSALQNARARAGLTQVEAANRAGTSQPALARYECGDALPTLPTLERILAACDSRLDIRISPADASASPSSVRGRTGHHAARLRQCRRALLRTASRHGITRVRVFGSVARGEESESSDIDFLVELAPHHTLLDLVAFSREAEEILNLPVDSATPDMLKDEARASALNEALPL